MKEEYKHRNLVLEADEQVWNELSMLKLKLEVGKVQK